MHLLALGAFWHLADVAQAVGLKRLNAPFGARCFLAAVSCGLCIV